MGKKPRALDAIKVLPPKDSRHTWRSKVSAEVQKQYDEVIAYLRETPENERPSFDSIHAALKEVLGDDCPGRTTIRKDVANDRTR